MHTWQKNTVTSDNVDMFFGEPDTSGLIYNLYADVLLGLDLVPSEVYATLTNHYNNAAGKL